MFCLQPLRLPQSSYPVYGSSKSMDCRRDSRLLGKTKWTLIKEDGVASGFSDMSHLSPEAQNRRLEAYNTKIRNVVRGFLLQFSGHQTFHRRPEMVVKQGPLEIRTMVMKSIGLHPKDFTAAAAYLVTAADPIPYPSDQELEDWTGWNPQILDILNDLHKESLENHMRTEKMAVMMSAILKRLVKLDNCSSPPRNGITEGIAASRGRSHLQP